MSFRRLTRPLLAVFLLHSYGIVAAVLTNSTYQKSIAGSPHIPTCSSNNEIMVHGCERYYECDVTSGDNITLPCGEPSQGVSFTYTLQRDDTLQCLGIVSHALVLKASPELDKQTIRCLANTSSSGATCYGLRVRYAPRENENETCPSGFSKWPQNDQPFCLKCPLVSNPPPTNYTWKRYRGIDMQPHDLMELPDDFMFTNNRQQWTVKSYDPYKHNGMYVCYASNYLGTHIYENPMFYLQTDACSQASASSSGMFTVYPSAPVLLYKKMDLVVLNCTASRVKRYGNKPYWFAMRNGSKEYCDSTELVSQDPYFNEDLCRWTNTLTVRNFSGALGGNYYCGYGHHWVNQTVSLEACYEYDEDMIRIDITPHNPTYLLGSDMTLTCTVSNTSKDGEIEWILPQAYTDLCQSNVSECFTVTEHYDESHCQWISTLRVKNINASSVGNYTCVLENHNIREEVLVQVNDGSMQEDMSKMVGVGVAVAVLILVLTVVLATCVGVAIVKQCTRRPSYVKFKEPPRTGYQYDIFISAHSESRALVEERILKPLEQGCNPPYRVCWHMRDFIAGVPITEQICEAIATNSRKVVFVFSENFMDSPFCKVELTQAYHRLMTTHTRCLIPLALSEKAVPRNLKNMLTYWPVVLTNEDNFISKLTKLIGEPLHTSTEPVRDPLLESPCSEEHISLL